jgi:hypothetical protein
VRHLQSGSDEAEPIAALEAAVDTYRGHLADGIHADWLIIDREAESRRFGDACARLADLTVRLAALDDEPDRDLYALADQLSDQRIGRAGQPEGITAQLPRHAPTEGAFPSKTK